MNVPTGFLYVLVLLRLKSYLRVALKKYIYLFGFLMFIFINLPQLRHNAHKVTLIFLQRL